MGDDKDKNSNTKNVNVNPGKAMDDAKCIREGKKREANFPGGSENAAGADAKERIKRDNVGSEPIPSSSIDKGNKDS